MMSHFDKAKLPSSRFIAVQHMGAYPGVIFVSKKCDFDHLQGYCPDHIILSMCNAPLDPRLSSSTVLHSTTVAFEQAISGITQSWRRWG